MQNLSLIWELTKRDFTEQYAGSILGSIWAIIWPLVNLFIYIVVFGKLMGGRLPGSSDIYAYSIYLTVGLAPWTLFSNVIVRSSSTFLDKKHIISKITVSLPSLLVYISLSETITFLITMGLFFIFLIVTQYQFSFHLILFPLIYYLQQVFALGIGLLAATLTVFFRDFKQLIGITLQLWFWFTPIVYVVDILPDTVKSIVSWNPAYIFITAYRSIFVFKAVPDYQSIIILLIISHVLVFVSYVLFRFIERDIRDFL